MTTLPAPCLEDAYTDSCSVVTVSDADKYENIVIDEEFARKKGCAMPELVNLLDDPDVLLHLKVRPALCLYIIALIFDHHIYYMKVKCNI